MLFIPSQPLVTFVRKCTYLFSAHSPPYLPLRKKGGRDSPLNWGLLSAVTPGLCSSVSKSFETTGLKMPQHAAAHRHQMFYTAHQTQLRRGFHREASQPAYSAGYSLFLFAVTTGLQTREEDNIVFPHVW